MSAATQAPRLFCDAMLAGLTRWLRAAGHDTALAPINATDRTVRDACRSQARILLTRDRHLAAHAGAGVRVVLLTVDGLDAQAAELATALDLDWVHAPFTRCLLDNTPLHEATPDDRERVPPRATCRGHSVRVPPAAGSTGRAATCGACRRACSNGMRWPGPRRARERRDQATTTPSPCLPATTQLRPARLAR